MAEKVFTIAKLYIDFMHILAFFLKHNLFFTVALFHGVLGEQILVNEIEG